MDCLAALSSSSLLSVTAKSRGCSQNLTPPAIIHEAYIPFHIFKHPCSVLLELCSSIEELRQFITPIFKTGLYNQHLFQTKLVSLFCRFGSMHEAAKVFDSIDDKLDVLYHTMFKGYAKNASLEQSLTFLCRMRRNEISLLVYDFTYLLKVCVDSLDLRRGREIHGQLVSTGIASNTFAMTSVINMYAKCGQIDDAYKLFDRMSVRDSVSWTAIISGYAQNGFAKVALELVISMQEELKRPDVVTLVSILPAAADMGYLMIGKSIHGYILKSGYELIVDTSNALMDMYSKCGLVSKAQFLFDAIHDKTVVSWNSMIDGYVQSGHPKEALFLFQQMLNHGVKPTNVTLMEALHACAASCDIIRGYFIHVLAYKLKLESDVSVMNWLISMYFRCKKVEMATKIFANLEGHKTLVSWNAMISGFAQNGLVNEALSHFCMMPLKGSKPDSFTMVSVITAIADLSMIRQAKWIHGVVLRNFFGNDVLTMTALVDMYAKCGDVVKARAIFDAMDERHVSTWNSMIDGYGIHGLVDDAAQLFSEMQDESLLKPNDVMFLNMISACSHTGLVEEGREYFTIMMEDYNLVPTMDHYRTMVDLIGRAGRLDGAWRFIETMPIEPGISVFGAMLGACEFHKNVEFGEKAAEKLFVLEPEHGGYHISLANIYATASMWDKASEVKASMRMKGLSKPKDFSLVNLANEIHTFYSGSTKHPQFKLLHSWLETLMDEIISIGYVPDANSNHDVEDDMKEQLLNIHSEKLGIAFGILNTSPGTTIHIRKNLRVCGDCHNTIKYISVTSHREIVVRDIRRFHHFKDGTCSCGDYW